MSSRICGLYLIDIDTGHSVGLRVLDLGTALLGSPLGSKPAQRFLTSARPLFVTWSPFASHILQFSDSTKCVSGSHFLPDSSKTINIEFRSPYIRP